MGTKTKVPQSTKIIGRFMEVQEQVQEHEHEHEHEQEQLPLNGENDHDVALLLGSQRLPSGQWHTLPAHHFTHFLPAWTSPSPPSPSSSPLVFTAHHYADVLDVVPRPNAPLSTRIHKFVVQQNAVIQLNKRARKLLESSKGSAGVQISNGGSGFHTPEKLLDSSGELQQVCIAALEKVGGTDLTATIELTGWVNEGGDGAYNTLHDHGTASWSLVYYAAAPEGSGDLLLRFQVRPRSMDATFIRVQPEEGVLLLFPSYVPHAVLQNNFAERETRRISVAVNAKIVFE